MMLCLLFIAATALSQTPPTARTFSATGANGTHVGFAAGLPFSTYAESAYGSVTEGVMHSQLIQTDLVMEGCQNAPGMSPEELRASTGFFQGESGVDMVFNGVNITVLPAGHYDSTSYDAAHYNWNAQFNYDSITTLVLDVWPIYELFDTLYLDSAVLATYAYDDLLIPNTYPVLHGGPNQYDLATVQHDCDSIRHFFVNLCGGSVADADGNPYTSVFIGTHPHRYCWTAANMRTTTYNDGSEAPNMVYVSPMHPDAAENLQTYGRLYTWYSAVGLPDNDPGVPATTTNGGFVTGICPPGWHIPNSENGNSIASEDATGLKSTTLWLYAPGTNSSGFNARPAGLYNPNTSRFENLLGETHFWTDVARSPITGLAFSLVYNCENTLLDDYLKNYGLSVRCVKNQIYDNDGNELND